MHLSAVFLSALVSLASSGHPYPPPAPFHPPDTAERIRSMGYPAEKHRIVTEDGYILTAFRIPYGKNDLTINSRPLILQHGVLCSSDCWVLSPNQEALGFVLADAGYDVWLTNSRGNTYSRNHINYTSKDPEFWNYSFHEMGYYDLPATVDYILNLTSEPNLFYIGHSQGTAIFFVMASSRPEYNKKIRAMSAMAPIAYLDNTKGAINTLGKISKWLISGAHFFNLKYVLDRSSAIALADHILCTFNLKMCDTFISFIVGFDSVHLDKALIPSMADICPTGASIKQLTHFAQLIDNGGKFTWFDYGKKNKIIYNSPNPPEYNLTAISCPILLYYGPNDYISSIPEVKRIYSKLQVVPDIKEVSTYNHLDFMWAIDAKNLIYDHIIHVFNKF